MSSMEQEAAARSLCAWRWIRALDLAWGEPPAEVADDAFCQMVQALKQGERDWLFFGARSGAGNRHVWAECARLAELDAQEEGDPYLVELAQEMGRAITSFYAAGMSRERFEASVRSMFGRYHEWDREGDRGGWTNRIGDLSNDAEWAVSIIDWHRGEIGTWRLLARLLAARALRLARQWYTDEREVFERLQMDEFSVAPQMFGALIEDSLWRVMEAR